MPLYNYKCNACEKTFEELRSIEERAAATCPVCEAPATKQLSIDGTDYHPFPEGVFEHIATTPIYVNDKPHLKRLCREHGVMAPGLLGN